MEFGMLFLLLIISLANGEYYGYYPTPPTRGSVWPMPQHHDILNGYMHIQKNNFNFTAVQHNCEVLEKAFKRYEDIIFSSSSKSLAKENRRINSVERNILGGYITELVVNITSPCQKYPSMEMDEVYQLQICTPYQFVDALLTARSVWGALRGLETFAQLVMDHPKSNDMFINCTRILDYPRFPYRGVMFDTSRHYLPVDIIKENLDLMSINKFNVFHWHITDDQSFPYVSNAFPDLSKKGAYNSLHLYQQEDVDDIIEYARLRGIRVIPEFDTPGHTRSWGYGQPGLLTPCYTRNEPNGEYGPIDPSNEDNYKFLETFFDEVTKKFPDRFLHLGADEVYFKCWESSPLINNFMNELNITGDYPALENYYVQRFLDVLSKLQEQKEHMVWQEVYDNGVNISKDVIVHVWKFPNNPLLYTLEMDEVTRSGHRAVLSACWYLNYINYGTDWHKYYDCEPTSFGGTREQRKLVLGGEACLWGEFIDETNVISRTWPRASAVAERLWSPASKTQNVTEATPRIIEHRCRMWKRGYPVQPIAGPGFCEGIP